VDHGILLSILEKSFGVTGTALDWIRSFLVGRFQIFQIGPDKSNAVIVFFGLPQSTILGPLFYIVYTADIETIMILLFECLFMYFACLVRNNKI